MNRRAIEKEDLKTILYERSLVPETLRTEISLNYEMQEDWFLSKICDRNSDIRYFIFQDNDIDRGYGGLENIQWSSRIGEISVLVYHQYRGMGYGRKIVDSILDYGFNVLGLATIFGEVYTCGNTGFWEKIIEEKGASSTILPNRKYFGGKFHNSIYFTFSGNKCPCEYNANVSSDVVVK